MPVLSIRLLVCASLLVCALLSLLSCSTAQLRSPHSLFTVEAPFDPWERARIIRSQRAAASHTLIPTVARAQPPTPSEQRTSPSAIPTSSNPTASTPAAPTPLHTSISPVSAPVNASSSSASVHSFHPLQQVNEFTMRVQSLMAPWSPRLLPAVLEMNNPLTVRTVQNRTVTLRPGWLMLYEGNYYDPYNGGLRMENDVWASDDDGITWELIAGISQFGQSGLVQAVAPYFATSFQPRGGSNNCEDPVSDDVYSIGGYVLSSRGTRVATSDVWFSVSGLQWARMTRSTFSPARWYASCDVNTQSHVLLMGGELGGANGGGGGQLLNDVWAADQSTFRRQTDRAPWSARGQHLVLVGYSVRLTLEVVYLLGGAVFFGPSATDASQDRQTNDVWASTDEGRTWGFIATAPWLTRYGHTGVVTKDGALVVMGGFHTTLGQVSRQVLNDVWSSFDGGRTWRQCYVEQATRFNAIRGMQGSTLTSDGYLYLASGSTASFNPDTSDVWQSAFRLTDSATLADVCNQAVPTGGIGLQNFPTTVEPPPTFWVDQQTATAPWSWRIQPAVLWMYRPIQYVQVGTNRVVNSGSPWLLLFEGSLTDGNTGLNENDVWASTDEGRTWDLISGISRLGTSGYVESKLPLSSFKARGASSNCEDPTSDTVYSIGGINLDGSLTNEVWRSEDGLYWLQVTTPTFSPARYFSSCDINTQSHLLSMGGVGPDGALLNDVWLMQTAIWTRVSERAPWPARCEHLVLVGDSPLLKVEMTYVLGGATGWLNGGESSEVSNDVWISVDEGAVWALVTAAAPWSGRWGHSGVITSGGVLLVFGGTSGGASEATYQSYSDMWASFDGGISWSQCAVEGGANNGWIRGEQGSTLTDDDYLLLAGGYFYRPGAREDGLRDTWRSTFSLADNAKLARICNTTIPAGGVGLQKWPGPVSLVFGATQISRETPFSYRYQPAVLTMYNPITYTQVDTLAEVTTGSPWLLMYEGTLNYLVYGQFVQENDVWASSNEGRTWDLISGISYFGSSGVAPAILYASSFTPRVGSTNCEDPTSDVVYSLGGQLAEGTQLTLTNQVWQSEDALVWRQVQMDTFAPTRTLASCDVNSQRLLLLMGGQTATGYINDVWHATDNGNTWTRITDRAPWTGRSEHLVLVGVAPVLDKELVYVIGGFQVNPSAANDVWVSSDDGRTWEFVSFAPFGPRWGHGGVITAGGALMVFGGTTPGNRFITYHDAWLSFDGGLSWSSCALSAGTDSVFIRGEQGVGLTAREELLIAAGLSYSDNGGVARFRDMWQTQFSLADITQLAVMCNDDVPITGIGLPAWPPTNLTVPIRRPSSTASNGGGASGSNNGDGTTSTIDNGSGGGGGGGGFNMSALVITFCVVVGVGAVAAGGYWWYKRRGSGGRFSRLNRGGGGGGALDLSEWSGRNREFSDSSVAEWAGLSRGSNNHTNGSSGGGLSALKRWGGGGWAGGNNSNTGHGSDSSNGNSNGNGNGTASDNYYTNSSSHSNHGRSGGGADGGFSRGGSSLLAEEPYHPPNYATNHSHVADAPQYNMELSGRQRFGGDPLGASSSSRQAGQVSGGWGGDSSGGDPLGGRPVHSSAVAGGGEDAGDPFGIRAAGRIREWH